MSLPSGGATGLWMPTFCRGARGWTARPPTGGLLLAPILLGALALAPAMAAQGSKRANPTPATCDL
jgi:hypothetical protein